MPANDILKNYQVFVDGRGYAGQVMEYTPPSIALVTEDHRAAGMDAPVKLDMGMEAMETSFVMTAYDRDVLSLFGVAEGNEVPFKVRGALESADGTVTPIIHEMRGKILSIDRGTWQAGTKPSLTVSMNLIYYKEDHGGQVTHEIDIENMIRIIGGVDRLAEIRTAIGL